MLYVSYRYRAKVGPYNYTVTDTDSHVFDVDEPESAEDLRDLERRVSTRVHKTTLPGCSKVTCTLLNWKPLKNSLGRRSSRTPALELDARMFDSREEAVSILRGMIAKEEITAEELQMAPCDVVERIEKYKVATYVAQVNDITWLNKADRGKLVRWLLAS